MLCACVTLALGTYVAARSPTRFDVEAVALRGAAVPLAIFFTRLGRWPALVALGILAAAVAWSLHAGLIAVAAILAAQVASQGLTMLLKHAFHRTRPGHWLHVRERDLSYPSGHAVSAVVFFAGFAVLAWHAPVPHAVAVLVVSALVLCVAGIPWSRLALGAHYSTDVIGGLFFGSAALGVALAALTLVQGTTAIR